MKIRLDILLCSSGELFPDGLNKCTQITQTLCDPSLSKVELNSFLVEYSLDLVVHLYFDGTDALTCPRLSHKELWVFPFVPPR